MADVGAGRVLDSRTGKEGPQLKEPPFRGRLGQEIFENVSEDSWKEWTDLEVKLINEYRLNLADKEHRKVLYGHMRDFFNLPEKD